MNPFSLFRRRAKPPRSRELAAAGAPLGLTPVPGLEAYAKFVLQGTVFDWSRVVAAIRGTTAHGELSIIDLGLANPGDARASHVETVAVFHGEHGLPRMVVQPRGTERLAEVQLRKLHFKQPHPETSSDDETYFSLSYTVQAEDEAAVLRLFSKATISQFVQIEDARVTPCLDVLPDRIAFCRASKAVGTDDLPTFLAQGQALIQALRSAIRR
ncbi:MAG: hypothetical protein QM765_18490 [Myxococcales bacterium]